MTVRLLDPRGMMEQEAYHHVAVARGTTWVTVAGRWVGAAVRGRRRWGDLATQVGQALRNVGLGLAGAGPASRTWSG